MIVIFFFIFSTKIFTKGTLTKITAVNRLKLSTLCFINTFAQIRFINQINIKWKIIHAVRSYY